MAGKLPAFRLVIGKKTCGVLWSATSKAGTAYHSGTIDVTALREALKENPTKKQQVRINRAGDTAEHDVIRVAMFDAVKKSGNASF